MFVVSLLFGFMFDFGSPMSHFRHAALVGSSPQRFGSVASPPATRIHPRHAKNRLTMQTAAMERVPDSLVPPWVISARPMEPGTAVRIHGIYNARE